METRSLSGTYPKTIYVLGRGSHAQVVRDIYAAANPQSIIHLVEFDFLNECLHLKASDSASVPENEETWFILGIGDNALRKRLAIAVEDSYGNHRWIAAVHPSATIMATASLGRGVVVGPNAVIGTEAKVGCHSIINTGATVDHHCKIEKYCHIAPKATLCGHVFLGEGSFVGAGACAIPNTSTLPWSFVKAMRLYKGKEEMIPIYEPNFEWIGDTSIQAIHDGWISSHGKNIATASSMLEDRCGEGTHCLLVNSGTSATHCLFLALKKFHPQVEIIYVPNHVYVAVWNTALYVYERENLVVLPTDAASLNIRLDDEILTSLAPNSALVIVNNTGNMIPIHLIHEKRPDIIMIEDNCEGFMGSCKGEILSPFVLCSSISFFGNKNITTGEGGAVLTRNREVYNFLKKTCSQGMTDERYIHDTLGFNYRMTNIQAGFLIDQLDCWEKIAKSKKRVYMTYQRNLRACKKVIFPQIHPDTEPSYWMVTIRILRHFRMKDCIEFFKMRRIDIRPFFYPFSIHCHLRELRALFPESFPGCTNAHSNVIMLPSYPHLKDSIIEYICKNVIEFVNLEDEQEQMCDREED